MLVGVAQDTWGEAKLPAVDSAAETLVELSKCPEAMEQTFNPPSSGRRDEIVTGDSPLASSPEPSSAPTAEA
jgi:hypothetical protein